MNTDLMNLLYEKDREAGTRIGRMGRGKGWRKKLGKKKKTNAGILNY